MATDTTTPKATETGHGPDPEPAGKDADPARTYEDDIVEKVRQARPSDGSGAEYADVLREALARLSTEGRLSAAHSIVNFYGGVAVGGDFTMGRRGGRDTPDLVAVDVAAELRLFVPPPDFTRAAEALERTGLVVLSGPESGGKHWAALALAERRHGSVHYLRLRRSLAELAAVKLEPGATYVVVDLATSLVAGLDDHWLRTTGGTLREVGCAVILTISRSQPLRRTGLRSDCVIDPFGPPDVTSVVRTVTDHECPPAAKDALADLLAHDDVRALLAVAHPPYAARRIAAALLDVATGAESLETALRVLGDAGPRVAEWFAVNPETPHRAFAVATAVLHGASFPAVADAALDLRDRVNRRSPAADLSFRALLADHASWIEVADVSHDTAYGPVPVHVVRFTDVGTQPAVLRHVFDTYDHLRRPMIAWLHDLGATPQPASVRARAAAAAGQLAQWDLPYCLHHLIQPWAVSDSAEVRRAAALALTVCGSSASHHAQVWQLLEQWCQTAGNQATSTAVEVLGGALGGKSPAAAQAAMTVLRQVAERAEWELVANIADAVLELTSAGQIATVLAALQQWTTKSRSGSVRLTGLLAFLAVAGDCGGPRPGLGWWPALLTGDGALRHASVTLWARAFDTKPVRAYALEVLRTWVDLADAVPAARRVLGDVVGDSALQGDRQDQRLSYWMNRWATDPQRPSAAAEEILGGFEEA